jgi:hypothetical protein
MSGIQNRHKKLNCFSAFGNQIGVISRKAGWRGICREVDEKEGTNTGREIVES